MVKKVIKKLLYQFGYKLASAHETPFINRFTTEEALKRCIERGLRINTVIDVGASDGRWSRTCMKYFPQANYLLIEAQDDHREGLEQIKNEFNNVNYVLAAAGSREGEIYFNNEQLFGGIASDTPFDNNCIKVKVTTIDKEIERLQLKGPFLIKLDTHGFEVPILEGASAAIKNSGLFIIESYNYKITDSSLRYFEMCKYMENLGFSSIEMVDLMLREKDHSFWQMDLFFIPSASKEFDYISYK
jgi:FkbM family methyltransferase